MKFPFFSRPSLKVVQSDWNLYSIQEEFDKYFKSADDKLDCDWRISEVNKNFTVRLNVIKQDFTILFIFIGFRYVLLIRQKL